VNSGNQRPLLKLKKGLKLIILALIDLLFEKKDEDNKKKIELSDKNNSKT